jgi:hypothetical protein
MKGCVGIAKRKQNLWVKFRAIFLSCKSGQPLAILNFE